MVLKLLYSASDSVQVLRCFYVRRSIGSVEKSSGRAFIRKLKGGRCATDAPASTRSGGIIGGRS